MDKLKMHTPDLTQQNIARIRELFPSCVTEAKDPNGKPRLAIDFDQLRQELSDHIVEGPQERYHLNWPGKREALLTANAPIAKTLRPVREESVDFDTTRNLFIEGDNLDALKLLQETYLGKVKMIYIDPPYNTGNDFVYEDDFAEDIDEFLKRSNQKDDDGNRLVANTEANGRFHSDWLSMMYPRLKLARNILNDSGVLFVSIDDGEHSNIKKLCDEIFGEENFVGNIVWKNVTDNNPSNIATEHEYVVVYAKSKTNLEPVWKSSLSDVKDILVNIGNELIQKYEDEKVLQEKYSEWFKANKAQLWPLENYKFIDKQGVYSGERGVHNPGKEGYRYDIIHPVTKKPCKQPLMGYRFPESTMKKMIDEGRIIFGEDEDKLVEIKVYAKDFEQKLSSVINLDGRSGANELKELFPEVTKIFTNPKTIKLLENLISFVTSSDDIIVDFFSGSGSTAHAVMKLNAEDDGRRKFVLVQLPEPTYDLKDGKEVPRKGTAGEAYKAGFRNIAEITKERIRRAARAIKKQYPDFHGDLGFRVLKIDTSNMADVYYTPDEVDQQKLLDAVSTIKPDRDNPEDLLFQVLLDWGVDLTLPIRKEQIQGKGIYFVDNNALAACFDKGITEDLVKELAGRNPLRVVFRDDGFESNVVKINVDQIFKQLSPSTEVKSI
jgi:adenine-specific DNA-methyltransferase